METRFRAGQRIRTDTTFQKVAMAQNPPIAKVKTQIAANPDGVSEFGCGPPTLRTITKTVLDARAVPVVQPLTS